MEREQYGASLLGECDVQMDATCVISVWREEGRRKGILLSRRLMGKAEMKTHSATVYDLISHPEHRQPSDALPCTSESRRLFFSEGSALTENSKYHVMRKTPCMNL